MSQTHASRPTESEQSSSAGADGEAPRAHSAMLYAMRDIMDAQLMSADHRAIGRVADVALARRASGELALVAFLMGPQALAGRVSARLRRLFIRVLRGRFDARIPLDQVRSFGPSTVLSGQADDYLAGQSERWLARNLWRWIPGSGYHSDEGRAGRPPRARRRRETATREETRDTRGEMHLADLVGKTIRTAGGELLGHVVEVIVEEVVVSEPRLEVRGLLFGSYGMLYRLRMLEPLSKQFRIHPRPRFVPWSAVERLDAHGIQLRAGWEGRVATEPPPG